jgi:hypothetical protein
MLCQDLFRDDKAAIRVDGTHRFTRRSREALPASSRTSAQRYSQIAAMYTAEVAPTRPWRATRFFRCLWIRPTGNWPRGPLTHVRPVFDKSSANTSCGTARGRKRATEDRTATASRCRCGHRESTLVVPGARRARSATAGSASSCRKQYPCLLYLPCRPCRPPARGTWPSDRQPLPHYKTGGAAAGARCARGGGGERRTSPAILRVELSPSCSNF